MYCLPPDARYNAGMGPTRELIDAIYIDKIMRARRSSIEQKLLDGPRLFVFACEASRAGIRAQHPDATPAEVDQLLRARIELGRRREAANRG